MVRRWADNLDMYRRVPGDLLEGTKRGGFISTLAIFIMATLIFLETKAFYDYKLATDLKLDVDNDEKRVRVNFNITMMDLKCDFVSIDTVSQLGTQQNITQHVTKWNLDQTGVRARYLGRNRKQKDILLHDSSIDESHDNMLQNGEDVLSLHPSDFEEILSKNTYVFIDFYANWCSHCRALAPTWERLAEVMSHVNEEIIAEKEINEWAGGRYVPPEEKVEEVEERADAVYRGEATEGKVGDVGEAVVVESNNEPGNIEAQEGRRRLSIDWEDEDLDNYFDKEDWYDTPVVIARLDCVEYPAFCAQNQIRSYPTLRLFVNGKQRPDYHGDRTVIAFTHFLASIEMEHENSAGLVDRADQVARQLVPRNDHWSTQLRRTQDRVMKREWIEKEHPGCQLSGFLMVDRTPGNFHLLAASQHHDIEPTMTNVSHEVHHLSFGEPRVNEVAKESSYLPPGVFDATRPMDGNAYVTKNLHEAYHHYLKVVTTNFNGMHSSIPKGKGTQNTGQRIYQIQQQSQLSFYDRDEVPEARFAYDLSPISVTYRRKYRKWYDYLTSIVAIIGGSFTVLGLLDSTLMTVSKGLKKL
uniref:Thioredoxin domain-containing protein n=1 Tax=Leptocylindrus danicus TaxID=163516 RepID=A0A6U2NA74_9STRA|mmetsp:Transcript_20906/g.31183  ORF Transcript_20906/g.31183 Transcript_20906/m.31183 type:complete len:583 (+) Transcript_20906:87-1835(+)